LHGHAFHVVRSAGNTTYNYDNPVIRDVVSNGDPGDNVTIRFMTDNPGPWFLHCHIDWHLERRAFSLRVFAPHFSSPNTNALVLFVFIRGFAVVFAEDVPEVVPDVKPTGTLRMYSS